jgi:hypothetical protein
VTYIDLPLSGGILQYRRILIFSNYFLTTADNYVGCNASAGNITLHLPPANTVNNGRCFVIKDEAGSCSDPTKRVFISPNGTEKIDGSNSIFSILAGYESVTLVCNGVDEWFII